MVRTVQRSPTPTPTPTPSPLPLVVAKVYSSPEIGKMNEVKEISSSYTTEVSPRCFGRNDHEEKENGMRHSLSGMFPTVSLFKEYQNAAMAVINYSNFDSN